MKKEEPAREYRTLFNVVQWENDENMLLGTNNPALLEIQARISRLEEKISKNGESLKAIYKRINTLERKDDDPYKRLEDVKDELPNLNSMNADFQEHNRAFADDKTLSNKNLDKQLTAHPIVVEAGDRIRSDTLQRPNNVPGHLQLADCLSRRNKSDGPKDSDSSTQATADNTEPAVNAVIIPTMAANTNDIGIGQSNCCCCIVM